MSGLMSEIKLSEIVISKLNPRKTFNKKFLDELTESIRSKGVLQPILLREIPTSINSSKYEIVCGEQRFKASQAAGLETIPAVIRECSDQEVLEIQIIENLQRADIHRARKLMQSLLYCCIPHLLKLF